MPEKSIIALDEAQAAAVGFLEKRLQGLKKVSISKVQLTSVEGITTYQVEGVASIGGWWLGRGLERPIKVQVNAADRTIIGFET
jgi:hypothetical protein